MPHKGHASSVRLLVCACVVCLRPLGIQTVTSSHTRRLKILLKVPPSAKDKSSNGSFPWEGLAIFQTFLLLLQLQLPDRLQRRRTYDPVGMLSCNFLYPRQKQNSQLLTSEFLLLQKFLFVL